MIIKPQQPLTEEQVTSVNFFDSDLSQMDAEKEAADALFNELHDLFNSIVNSQYAQTRSVRDIAEFAKTLVQARTMCIDAVNKKHVMKKNISDMISKQKNVEMEIDKSIEQAKLMLKVIKQEGADSYGLKSYKDKKKVHPKVQASEREQLDQIVNKKINSSEIKLSKNDKLIGLANHIEIRYHRKKKQFVPIDVRTNTIVKGFPDERLPNAFITRFSNTHAYTNTGEVYLLYMEK